MSILIYDNEGNLSMEIYGYKYVINHKHHKLYLFECNMEYSFESIEHIVSAKGHFLKVVEK